MESKKINQLATELVPTLDDLTIIGDPTTGISRKITLSQMASLFTGTVEEYANLAAFPLVGATDTIYIALDTNILYRWSGSAYVELSPNIVSSLVFSDANGFDGTITLVGSVATLSITTALTLGSLPFIGASGALTQDNANLFYDDTNNRLGIATNAPTTPLDVFGSGIVSRINGTSTNNAFLGFSSAGTNKWSVGNVQSDHRFRIFSEANTSELITLLQTGEFGIGIANPTTKLHIDGGASALIANLDANVSVAKSLSFRSDNSNRINLEVSGTESGSDAGANFFIRRYSDAGALIDTPLTITRSTGLITLATALSGLSASFTAAAVPLILKSTSATTMYTEWYYNTSTLVGYIGNGSGILGGANASDFIFRSEADFVVATGGNNRRLTISSAGAASFTGDVILPYSKSLAFNSLSNQYITADATNLYLGTANSARLIITSGGNVGIGTSSPDLYGSFARQFTVSTLTASGYSNITVAGGSGGGGGIDFGNQTIRQAGIYSLDGSALALYTNSTNSGANITERMRITSGGNTQPGADNAYSLGVSGTRWSAVWAANGTIQTSDAREKKDILNSDLGLEFISKLRPVCYKWKVGQNIVTNEVVKDKEGNPILDDEGNEKTESVTIPRPGKRTHYGLIAQEVEELLDGKDFGGFIHDQETDAKGLRYDQFIPILIKAIQELKAELDLLKGITETQPNN